MSKEYTFTYFNSRGMGEPGRFILAYGGAKWNDNRMEFFGPGRSPIPDEIKARLNYKQVPLLEFEDKKLVQSSAIFRYLANQFGLAGKDDFEAAQCDETVEAVKDIFILFWPIMFGRGDGTNPDALKNAVEKAQNQYLSKLDEAVQENGGYLVGSGLTWADIFFACGDFQLKKRVGVNLTTGYPALAKLVETVFNAPGIKEYVAKRPDSDW